MTYQKSNFETLPARHQDVYRKFFAENDVVLSACFSQAMTAGIGWRVGAPNIRVKLPFRIYCGLAAHGQKGKITSGENSYFDLKTDHFLDPGYEPLQWDETLPHLEKLIAKALGASSFEGVSINILAERGKDRGFDTPAAILVMAALYLYYGLISPELLQTLPGLSFEEINKPHTDAGRAFDELFRAAIKLWVLSQHGSTSGSTDFSGLVQSDFPIVYVTEERGGSVEKPYFDLPPWYVGTDVDQLGDLKFLGMRLNEMSSCTKGFPLDVAAVYPGTSRTPYAAAEYVNSVLLPGFDTLRNDVGVLFSRVVKSQSDDTRLPPFLRNMDVDSHYWQEYGRGQIFSQLYLVRALTRVYRDKLSSAAIDEFLETIDGIAQVNAPFEETPSENLQHIVRMVRSYARERGVKIALRAHNWGKMDGYVVVYSRPNTFQHELEKVVADLQQQYNEHIYIDFASYKDGWGSQGLAVEQFTSKGIYSPFINKNARQLRSWDKKEGEKRSIVDDAPREDFDILLDKINGRIYIKGRECTSKDLPSQKSAIEILAFLFERRGEQVSNKELPAQNYSRYRNELQSKIITPLNKLVESRLNKKLDLKIHGKLTDFDVVFNPGTLKVGVLEKL